MSRAILAAALAALALSVAACGQSAAGDPDPNTPDSPDESGSPALGMCAEGVTDCVDVVIDPEGEIPDELDVESERVAARGMLGLAEDELSPDVRVARRGDEQMMLTEDYVLGRKTVELDADDTGVFRVVSVVVELPEGPETVTE